MSSGSVTMPSGRFGIINDRFGSERPSDQDAALESRVAERTKALAATVNALESFTYAVAHDLRAPLDAIQGFSRALIEDYGDRLDGEPGLYVDRICQASERMSLLVDDLLKFARIGRGDVQHAPIALSALVIETAARVAERYRGRTVHLVVQPRLATTGDAKLLGIALEHVLDNAWKFTRHQAHAQINVFANVHHGQLEFCVADNGVGFDMRDSHKLFAPFQRLHRQEAFEGAGIGIGHGGAHHRPAWRGGVDHVDARRGHDRHVAAAGGG